MSKQLKQLYQEYPEPAEDQLVDAIWQEIADRQAAAGQAGEPVRRGFNSKTYGGFLGTLEVLDNPETLRAGLFATPATYKVLVRFGGGASSIGSDENKKDPCSISIKVIGAPGEKIISDDAGLDSQNFVMLNSNALFVPNLRDFHHVIGHQMSGNKLGLLAYFLNPFAGGRFGQRLAQFKNVNSLCGQRLGNDLSTMRYWSMTPYALGDKACKYKLTPDPANADHGVSLQTMGFDLLRENIEAIVKNNDIRFNFQVQVQRDPELQPIENAAVVWDEALTPPTTVARLRIPRQANGEIFQLVDKLSFNPWISSQAHRPMGSINRGRKKIYDLSFKNRRSQAGASEREHILALFPADER